jgi:hypothetical protein
MSIAPMAMLQTRAADPIAALVLDIVPMLQTCLEQRPNSGVGRGRPAERRPSPGNLRSKFRWGFDTTMMKHPRIAPAWRALGRA